MARHGRPKSPFDWEKVRRWTAAAKLCLELLVLVLTLGLLLAGKV
ncbi:hypothetical protein [Streptomyces sp. NPDC049555]